MSDVDPDRSVAIFVPVIPSLRTLDPLSGLAKGMLELSFDLLGRTLYLLVRLPVHSPA
jgi:hypothetical protein